MTYSSYQLDIFNWIENGSGNAIVSAVAGSGKTTTAIHGMLRMKGSLISICFNKKIAVELESHIASMNLVNAKGSTMHSVGWNAWKGHVGFFKTDNRKVSWIIDEFVNDDPEKMTAKGFIKSLVSFAKQYGIGLKQVTSIDDTEAWENIIRTQDMPMNMEISHIEAIEIAKEVLRKSNRDHKCVDFDDMIYLPLLFNASFKQYDWVIVDEAQDTNVVRKIIVEKLLKKNGRALFIGDPAQAIYMFTGAENDSMNILKEQFNCVELPLSTCYRCGKKIVEEAQKYSDQIQAFESNADGIVRSETYDQFLGKASEYHLTKNDGIICRNNAPLVALAFGLIRQGIGCRIEGRDIGRNLLSICDKWKRIKDLGEFTTKLMEFFDKEFEKAKGKMALQLLEDKMETLIILIDRVISMGKNDVQSLRDLIDGMFSDSDEKNVPNVVVLSSIHKSKGLEWDRCFILGMAQFQPSKYATTEAAQEQEKNISYVGITRAKDELVYITDVPQGRRTMGVE